MGNIYHLHQLKQKEYIWSPDNWINIPNKTRTERRRYFLMRNALVVRIVERLGDCLQKIVENDD